MVLNRVATDRAIGPKTPGAIWRRSRRSASKAERAVYLFSLHTIYGVLRISLMHLLRSEHQDRSDHFVQHGQRTNSRIFFWSNCAHRAIRDRAASVGPNPPRRNALRRRSKERLMATACSRGVPTAMHVPAPCRSHAKSVPSLRARVTPPRHLDTVNRPPSRAKRLRGRDGRRETHRLKPPRGRESGCAGRLFRSPGLWRECGECRCLKFLVGFDMDV